MAIIIATQGHPGSGPAIKTRLTAKPHDCREKVRPGNGRETGLGRAGVRAPKVGALGDAGSSCRKNAEKFFNGNK